MYLIVPIYSMLIYTLLIYTIIAIYSMTRIYKCVIELDHDIYA